MREDWRKLNRRIGQSLPAPEPVGPTRDRPLDGKPKVSWSPAKEKSRITLPHVSILDKDED
jgi:hypothetical protein